MENRKINGTETEVTTAEFNRYFDENYPYISHSLSNKEVEKWLNQDVIKRVSLSKKADYFQDYILSQGLEDDVQMMAGGNSQGKIKIHSKELTEEMKKSILDLSSDLQSRSSMKYYFDNDYLFEDYKGRLQIVDAKTNNISYLSGKIGSSDILKMMAGGNIQSIEKKVAEVNELIEMGNKNNVSVTDTSNTWQSPMKYKPFVYKNGILYENYNELDLYLYSKTGDRKWRIVKHKYTKSGDGVDTQKEVLNGVAKMYRKELKYYADYDNYMLRSKGKMMAGGSIDNENKLMVANNNKQLRHHTEELDEALENANHVPAWVVAKVNRSASDLSDATHYLEGVNSKYANGGGVGKYNSEKSWENQRVYNLDNGSEITTENSRFYGEMVTRIDLPNGEFWHSSDGLKGLPSFAESWVEPISEGHWDKIVRPKFEIIYANGGGVGDKANLILQSALDKVRSGNRKDLSPEEIKALDEYADLQNFEDDMENCFMAKGGGVGTTFIYEIGGL